MMTTTLAAGADVQRSAYDRAPRHQIYTKGKMKPSRFKAIIAVLVASVAAGCGGAGGIGVAPAPSLSGTWDGTWTSSRGGGGTFVATLSQSGPSLSGGVSVTGQPCLTGGYTLTPGGSVTGNNFNFAVIDDDAGFVVIFKGTVSPSGTSGSGTYSFCNGGDTGTFSMTRR